ncbi:hypothetical protein Tco_0123548 [Tanacetum coccineum]
MGECIAYQKMKITQLHIEKIIFQLLLYQSNAERLSGHMRSIVSMNGFIRVLQIPSALEDQREDNLLLVAYGNSADRRDCPFGSMRGFVSQKMPNPRRSRGGSASRKQDCNIEIKDKKGAENLAADYLSRLEKPKLGN